MTLNGWSITGEPKFCRAPPPCILTLVVLPKSICFVRESFGEATPIGNPSSLCAVSRYLDERGEIRLGQRERKGIVIVDLVSAPGERNNPQFRLRSDGLRCRWSELARCLVFVVTFGRLTGRE